jgi:hypothetical protein
MATTPTPSKDDVRYWQGRVFKHDRPVQGYLDTAYSVRIAWGGRRVQFALGTASKAEAAERARAIYRAVKARGWNAALAEWKSGSAAAAAAAKVPAPTIGEFLAAVKALHASKARTLEGYAGALRTIAAWCANLPPGGRGGSATVHRRWRESVETLKLSILTPGKIQQWREAFLARAGDDPVRQRRARVSANTFLREARSLFSPRYLEGLGETICLPDPLPFAGVKLGPRVRSRYQGGFDVAALVQAATVELAEKEPEMFKVFTLALCGGLRRNEIDKLEWRAFNWSSGTVNVAPTAFFRVKSEAAIRTVGLPPEVLARFRGGPRKCRSGPRSIGHEDIATTAGSYLEAKEQPVVQLGHLF